MISWRDLIRRAGEFRKQFAFEALDDLQKSLILNKQTINITFLQLSEFLSFEIENRIDQIVLEEDIDLEEQAQFKLIQQLCKIKNIRLISQVDSTLTHFSSGLKNFDRDNLIFTEFRKRVEKNLEILEALLKPKLMPQSLDCHQRIQMASLEDLDKQIKFQRLVVTGGETSARAHLENYFSQPDVVKSYKETRNGLLDFSDSTKFSPALSLGCLSARSIYHRLKRFEDHHGANESTYWIFFELLWRDYFKFFSFRNQNRLFTRTGIQNKKIKLLPKKIEIDLFQKWKAGATGVDFIDANMQELLQTGWMSNRGRQNVASFLVKNQGVDWRLGASYFEEMLIDYDCASNWGNWSYLAGVGTDPRDRIFNIEKQARDYDPDQSYVKRWLRA